MLRPKDLPTYERLRSQLQNQAEQDNIPGLTNQGHIDSLAEQIVESLRRKEYLTYVRNAQIDLASVEAKNPAFDPMRAAVYHHRNGSFDEAFWMLFLFAHFGKHRTSRWYYAQQVYAGTNEPWTWSRVFGDLTGFRDWLEQNYQRIQNNSANSGFGNHRKYESLRGWSEAGTGAIVESYVDWVGDTGTHRMRFPHAWGDGAAPTFDALYRSMALVKRLGRLGRFDYLTSGYWLGLTNAKPERLYLPGSTGPLAGARLLFDEPQTRAYELDTRATALASHLGVGTDVFEDAICNWNKSPGSFVSFRG